VEITMKKIVEVNDEGLEGLMGENVTLLCMNYFYTGKLIGVNATCVLLEDPKIVYETGEWTSKNYKDAQSLPGDIYVQTSAIEAFGILK
jgi:hypothetical protein